MFSLQGKNIFVVGGTAGLGLAVARSYVESGARVVIGGRRNAEILAEKIGAQSVRVDVADEQAVIDAFARVTDLLGKLDVLVNNVGIYRGNTLDKVSVDDQQFHLDVNINSVFWGLKHGPRHMNDGGSIINTSSTLVYRSLPGVGSYTAAKAAITGLMKTAVLELGPRGIRVNTVTPSTVVDTEANQTMPKEALDREVALVNLLTPLGRASVMNDYLGLFTLLASDSGSFINCQDIVVDGGRAAGIPQQASEKLLS